MSGYAFQSGGITVEGSSIIDETSSEAFLIRQNGDAGDVLTVDTRDPSGVSGSLTCLNITGNGGNAIVGAADDFKIMNLVATLTSGTQSMTFRGMQCQVNATGASVSTGVSGEGLRGAHFASVWDSTGTCAYIDGISCNAVSLAVSSGVASGLVTLQVGNRVVTGYSGSATGSGSITDSLGIYIVGPQNTSAGRTVANYYGIKIDDTAVTGVTNAYSIYTGTGEARFGGLVRAISGINLAASGQTTLTNYLESTFSPTVTLVGGAGNTVPQYSTNTGRYTRIGNRVFVDVYLTGDGGNEGAGTGQINIALPITASASHSAGEFLAGTILNNTNTNPLTGVISGSATTIALSLFNAINTKITAKGQDQNNATRAIRLKFSYEV